MSSTEAVLPMSFFIGFRKTSKSLALARPRVMFVCVSFRKEPSCSPPSFWVHGRQRQHRKLRPAMLALDGSSRPGVPEADPLGLSEDSLVRRFPWVVRRLSWQKDFLAEGSLGVVRRLSCQETLLDLSEDSLGPVRRLSSWSWESKLPY